MHQMREKKIEIFSNPGPKRVKQTTKVSESDVTIINLQCKLQ